jgi:hypothetical protein
MKRGRFGIYVVINRYYNVFDFVANQIGNEVWKNTAAA